MRILFISTFYPPYVIGGWEQLVQEINTGLQARGHTTKVITSTHGIEHPSYQDDVDRCLTLEANLLNYDPKDLFTYAQRMQKNLASIKKSICSFKPDIVFIHIMWNLSKGIAWQAEQLLPGRVVYYMADYWPYSPTPHQTYWNDRVNGWSGLGKRAIAPFALKIIDALNSRFKLQYQNVLCVSHSVKNDLIENAGLTPSNTKVVYNGIDTKLFAPAPAAPNGKPSLSLLFAGSLVWHKGVHTAIEAMATLAEQKKLNDITLTVVGSGHPDYEAKLRDMVDNHQLTDHVTFRGRVTRDQMPNVLREFDVLIFPSTWEEPLARMTQEAMASGLVVIGTTTGGTKEILVEGETGLTFPTEDATRLADQIDRLNRDRTLLQRLATTGREQVVAKFSINRMIDEIEAHLSQVAKKEPIPNV